MLILFNCYNLQVITPTANHHESIISLNAQLPIEDPTRVYPFVFDNPISHIIIDFSSVAFVDTVGCKIIKTECISVNFRRHLEHFRGDRHNSQPQRLDFPLTRRCCQGSK
ncbi:hypothetical protein DPMN_111775 [Dreissena polymorpha]|uniref:STAS domain-containing protein n=1 Tax=Dreissena polymorpha TaxID=45954 RepID=A0A9D4QP52_DREPO|nr:hypothetical protein DPMN_111775 [Dreissena polymorpha]